jgi:hypothetical protein
VLGAIGVGVYLVGKKQGWTIEGAMAKLGVSPQTAPGPSGGPGPAPAATPSPPVVADPNRCQFCGELKDPATGACACTLAPGAAPGFPAASTFSASPSTPGGCPRLIGMGGTYLGEIFPLGAEAVIGRDPTNPVPLDRDTTVSRRHARIVTEAGGFRIVDEGSSNGTFVNGARVVDTSLQPGDEVTIGGTRFRFEV